MNKYILISILSVLYLIHDRVFAQCGSFSITAPDESCLNENLVLTNNSSGFTSYEWDFCPNDLNSAPSASLVGTYNSIGRSDGIDIVKVGSNYYGFLISSGGNLFRLDFGNSFANTPIINNLGFVVQGYDIKLIEDAGGTWHAYIASTTNKIFRVDFNSGIEGAITSTDLGNFGGSIASPRGIATLLQGNDIYVFVTSSTNNTLSIIKFAGGINGVSSNRTISIANASQLIGVTLTRECDQIIAFATAVSNRKFFKVSLGNNPMDALLTSIEEIAELAGIQSYELNIIIEGSSYYLLIPTFSGALYQANFSSSLSNSPTLINQGDLSLLSKTLGSEFMVDSSQVVGFTYDYTTFELYKISYPNICDASISYSTMIEPLGINYSSTGKKYLSVTGFDNSGNLSSKIDSLTILELPNTNFSFNKACFNTATEFSDATTTPNGTTASWLWDFDGLATSTQQNPTFVFPATGTYNVSLTTTDTKGCSNSITLSVKIYSDTDVQPSFSYPPILCSNSGILFTDTSIYVEDVIKEWLWSFNGEGNSTEQNPIFTFATSGSKIITLSVTGTSGCVYSTTDVINVEAGPTTAFSFNNTCNGSLTTFTDATTGSNLTAWSWNFGDGTTSTAQSPTHTYANPGKYVVSLTVNNSLGCATTKTDTVYSHAIPVAAFSSSLPCSSTAIHFTDNSTVQDANLVAWAWDFGDGTTSTQQHPAHLFGQAGSYLVKLKAYSQFGCVDSSQTTLTVAQGPEIDFSWDATCQGEPTQFTDLTNTLGEPIQAWAWIIDGQLFTEKNPSYTFASTGTYPVQLTVTTQNNCAQTLTQDVLMVAPPVVQFGYAEGCGTTGTTFYDLTTLATDTIAAWEWRADGTLFGTDSASSTNLPPGSYNITLTLLTRAGCTEFSSQNITLIGSPQAQATANTLYGAAPLRVEFQNNSTGGNTYLWNFGDPGNATSSNKNPVFTYTETGSYSATLRVSSSPDCYDEVQLPIEVVAPLDSASIVALTPLAQSSKTDFVVTIQNNGTTLLNEAYFLEFTADYGSPVIEPLNTNIYAGNTNNYNASFALASQAKTKLVCVKLLAPGKTLLSEACTNLSPNAIVASPYPNPGTDYIAIDVHLTTEQRFKLRVLNIQGQPVLEREYIGRIGLNKITLDVRDYAPSNYLVEVTPQNSSPQRFRISVVR